MWDSGMFFAYAAAASSEQHVVQTLGQPCYPTQQGYQDRVQHRGFVIGTGAAGVCKLWSPFHIVQLLFFRRIIAVLNDTQNKARVNF
jgi:hypothetical protein